ncbi:MAG: hypothetical protein IPJ77_05170 [Planctomycetes bacterium]|nr:hypothetical protein [Planctomycetota bacterium]
MHTLPITARAQSVLTWYRVYCGAMAAMYLLCILGGILILAVDEETFGKDALQLRFTGIALAVFSAPAMAAFALGLFLPRKPWTWTYGLVLICLGLTSVCCLPACIPLLITWLKDDVKSAFGRVEAKHDPRDFSSGAPS